MDFDVKKLLNIPHFTFAYDNNEIRRQWIDILGDTKPLHDYVPEELVEVEVLDGFLDIQQGRFLDRGERCMMSKQRADEIRFKLGNKFLKEI